MSSHPAHPRGHPLRTRRVGVFGGTQLSRGNREFCLALGKELAKEKDLVIVSGGLKYRLETPKGVTADWAIISGALEQLKSDNVPARERIETILPEPDDSDVCMRFEEGNVVRWPCKTRQARRYKVVGSVDALVVIDGESTTEGGKGTSDMIQLAFALETPILPLPFTGGVAKETWDNYQEPIREWFTFDRSTALFTGIHTLREQTEDDYSALAEITTRLLLQQMKRKCFVIMPFDNSYDRLFNDAIKPAADESGFVALRTDQLDLIGNVLGVLKTGISTSACAIAVVTDPNPNVMYELGFAHALDKSTIIVCKKGEVGLGNLPFDIKQEFVVGYDDDNLPGLKKKIAASLDRIKTH